MAKSQIVQSHDGLYYAPSQTDIQRQHENEETKRRTYKQITHNGQDHPTTASSKNTTNTLSRRGCGTLLAYNPGGGPPPYGRNRPKPRKLHTYQTKFIVYYRITSKGGHTIQQNRKRISISMMHLQGCITTLRVLVVYRAHQLTKQHT